ncbi:ATP synthase subunit d, mitochondrial-like [Sipha flava]|jgi:F-type H+-transporting ATPase subunit d|uniref:ATP synthase subunit d, mitochondrial n=1 Tax=Sipha flava TaxID=143950 RepID=A0A8B8GP89_9HEMI|nr:ATP synthase subunit d, mitochondrial-like [Sipha flava]
MAAVKRFAQSMVNWDAIAERVPKAFYVAFKSKSDAYIRKMSALPVEPLKIDWALYKSKGAQPGVVENFEKLYETLKIPYPEDKYTGVIDCHEEETVKEIEQFRVEAEEIIKKAEKRLEEIHKLLPFGQMTYEDAAYVVPELTIDMVNKPSFWPHSEEDYMFDEPEEKNVKIEKQKKDDAAHPVENIS